MKVCVVHEQTVGSTASTGTDLSGSRAHYGIRQHQGQQAAIQPVPTIPVWTSPRGQVSGKGGW